MTVYGGKFFVLIVHLSVDRENDLCTGKEDEVFHVLLISVSQSMLSVRETDTCSLASSPEGITAKITATFGLSVPSQIPLPESHHSCQNS